MESQQSLKHAPAADSIVSSCLAFIVPCSAGYIVYLVFISMFAAAMFLTYRRGKLKQAYALPVLTA